MRLGAGDSTSLKVNGLKLNDLKSISADEKKWRAEADADAMARVEEIMADSSRRSAAIKVAKQRATELTKRANAMSRAAGNAPTGSRVPKGKKK